MYRLNIKNKSQLLHVNLTIQHAGYVIAF